MVDGNFSGTYYCLDYSLFFSDTGKVELRIARQIDNYGRCVDREFFILNKSKNSATNIVLSFDVDYFTKRGDIKIQYGDEKDALITSAMTTLLPRMPYFKVQYSLDYSTNQIKIPVLKPTEYIHFHYAGETIMKFNISKTRNDMLKAKDSRLMDKPRIISATRKNGTIKVHHVIKC